MLPQFTNFIIRTASKCYRTLPKSYRNYSHLAAFPRAIPENRITGVEQSFKRNYSCSSMLCASIPDLNAKKEKHILGLDIDHVALEDTKLVLEPYEYFTLMPKKTIRSYLINGFNYWMNLPDHQCEKIEQLINMMYESTFMLDDVLDQSDYRRGLPTAHKLYGDSRTQISGTVCLFFVLKKLVDMNNVKMIEVYADDFIQHYTGQYKEIHFRENTICPTIDQYKQICIDKNQPAINLIIKFMQAFSNCDRDFSQLAKLFGLYQQYMNDISNLCEPKYWDKKGFCEDISEGKYTLATIHAISTGTQEGYLVDSIMKQRTKDLPTLKYCLSLLEKLGSIDFAKKTTLASENELRKEIERLGGNPPLVECIDTLNTWTYEESIEDSFIQNS